MTTYNAPASDNTGLDSGGGWYITPSTNMTLTNITTYTLNVANRWKVGTTRNGSEVGSGTLTSNSSGTISLSLSASTNYWITIYDTGGNYVQRYKASAGFPVDATDFTINSALSGGTEGDPHFRDIASLSYSTGADYTKLQINIGDTWKSGAGMQINIGDAWKVVAGLQINIGDAWKVIF